MSAPLPQLAGALAVPASRLYGLAVAARNRRFDRGLGVESAGRPVASVGNITAGGTGKTPVTAWLARLLLAEGRRPVIAMRGYKAGRGGPSDEQAEYADLLPGVAVVADPDRLSALRSFFTAHPAADCAILDDGFQHRRVRRELDLVLIDATVETLGDRLLPAGRLREPPSSLRRADAVVVTRAEAVDDDLARRIREHHGRPPLAWCRHAWTGLRVHEGGAARAEPVEWLRGRRVLTMLGVGNPLAVLRQVEAAGARVATNVPVKDHQRYGPRLLETARRLGAGAEALVTTGKDWVKLRRELTRRPILPVVVPALEVEVFEGRQPLRDLVLERLKTG